MGTLTSSAIHLPAWDHLNTHVLEKELFLLLSTSRDLKTQGTDIVQGLALDWGEETRVPYHSTHDLFVL